MDRQVEFLIMWAVLCQPMIDWYLGELERWPEKVARRHWKHHMQESLKSIPESGVHSHTDEFTKELIETATHYVNLLIEWECFGDE